MAGLADILKGASMKSPRAPESEEAYEEAPASEPGKSNSAKGFARIAAQAIADNDIDAAADALESLVRACK